MRELIEILRQNPILIFLLATWLLGGIGKVLQRSREARNRQAPGLPTDASAPSESAPRRPTPEEVAREMRRALGLDPEPERPAPPERASQPEPRQTFEHDFDDEAPVEAPRKPVPVVRKPAPPPLPRRSVVRPEAPPTPLRPRELGRVSVHVAPKVGNDLSLVAEQQGCLVASAGLFCQRAQVRRQHVSALGISVAASAQGQGIGTALMAALTDYADRWGQILRIELSVFADNARAIALYERFGFVREGLHRAHALRDGIYVDSLSMARLHPNPPRWSAG